jgi:hypothetical protein
MHAGFSAGPSKILAVALAVTVAAATIGRTEWSDLAWFAAALTMGLLVSPMLRISYLVVLFIPLAIVRPSADGLWILTGALWLAVPGLLPLGLQVTLVLTICAAVTIGLEPRRSPSGSSRGVPLAVQQTRRAS